MKKTLTLVILLACYLFSAANPVTDSTARIIGYNFLKNQAGNVGVQSSAELVLAYTATSTSNSVYYYVYNIPSGFVIVSGDDNVVPVLGYSKESTFNPSNIPENAASWLGGYKNEIDGVIANHIPATAAITAKWANLLQSTSTLTAAKTTNAGVAPLLQTTWDQLPYYNDSCPYSSTYATKTVTGCVATATAQVMKYWNYPAQGAGYHSYVDPNFGTLSADFGSTTYNWGAMPNTISAPNAAIATLMYQVGVSVNMSYNVASQGGSSAYVIATGSPILNCAEYALKTYFSYSSSLQGIARSNYTDSAWMSLLTIELNASRPVIYAGFGTGGGHCFVCDGYEANNFFHFNWGWSGSYNGYFTISALNPGGVGTGGGSGGFNSGQQAIMGIQPGGTSASTQPTIELYNTVAASPTTISYAQVFYVNTNLANFATTSFTGDYCAQIFNSNGTLVDSSVISTNNTLPYGYSYGASGANGIQFGVNGSLALLPGTYTIHVFYRNTGGSWIQVANNGTFINSASITVVNSNSMEVSQAISTTPSTLIEGAAGSVQLNIANHGATSFTGTLNMSLYNMDGTYALNIGSLSNETLGAGQTFASPLTFSTANVNLTPGTYLLALQYEANGASSFQLAGADYYSNPVLVTVVTPPLQPDIYEVNNTQLTAYDLPITFTGNSASKNTVGSNFDIGTDVDYYKIDLPAGYQYSISPRLDDSYSSGNGQTYTVDAIFSYSTDGINYSTTYDDVLPAPVQVNGGTSVYFHVVPKYQGSTGTYLLDIPVITKITSFYYNGTGSIVALASWGTNTNGTGTNPLSFTNSGTTYFIPTTTSVTLPANWTVGGNLNIASGMQIGLNGDTLKVAGNVSDSGTISGAGSIMLNGVAAQTITGNGTVSNLTLNNTAGATITTGSNINITGAYTNTAGMLTTDSALTLVSNATGTGRISPIAAGSISGVVNVQQYIPGKRTFRFFAHPFSTPIALSQLENYIDVTGAGGTANGFTTTITNNPSAFWYNPVTGNGSTVNDNTGWIAFTGTNGAGANAWNAKEGIRVFVRGTKGQGLDGLAYTPIATTFTIHGPVNQGAVTIPFIKGAVSGYNLLGNPYPSPVDIGTPIYTAKQAGTISGSGFYVWNAEQQTQGAYVTVPIANTIYPIPANASFLINAVSNSSLAFTEANKASTDTALFKTTMDNGFVTLHLYDSSFNSWDELYLSFDQNASDSMEDNDAEKLHNTALDFYSLSSDNKELSIDTRPYKSGQIIPLGIQTSVQQAYIIKIESLDVPSGAQLMLHDKYLNQYQQLQVGAQYSFAVTADNASQGNDRFEIGLWGNANTYVANVTGGNGLKVSVSPNPATDKAELVYSGAQESTATIHVLDVTGKIVYSTNAKGESGNIILQLQSLPSGYYLVETRSGNEKIISKLVKQ